MTSRFPELVCPECGSNKFKFPKSSDAHVKCDDCGHRLATLDTLQSQIVDHGVSESRSDRLKRHAAEVADSHERLRASVAETDRLIVESNKMLKRHRKEVGDEED